MSDRREVIAIITADSRKLDPELAKGKRKFKQFSKEVRVELKQVGSSMTGLLGLGGMAGLLSAGKKVHEFQTRLVRLRIASGQSAETIKQLERSVFSLAKARGLDPSDVLAGGEKYAEITGDLQGFIRGMDQLGMVSAATGSNMDELATIAAGLKQSLGVNPEQWGLAFDILARQGKAGSIELKNIAAELPRVVPLFKQFGNIGVSGIAELGAVMQLSKGGFSTAAETAIGVQSLMAAIQKVAGKVQKKGAKGHGVFFGEGGKQRGLFDTVMEINKFTKGDPFMVRNILRDKEAINAYLAIVEGGKDKFQDLSDEIKATGTIQKDADIWDDSPAKKMASAQARLAEVFNDKLAGNIETVAKALEKVAEVLDLIGDHPYLAAALFGGGKVAGMMGGIGGMKQMIGPKMGELAAATNQIKGVGAAFGLAAVFTAAFQLGTWINDATGASHFLADGLWRMVNATDAAAEDMETLRDVIRTEVHQKLKASGAVSAGAFAAGLQGQQLGQQRAAKLLEIQGTRGLGYNNDLTRAYQLQQALGMTHEIAPEQIDKIIADQLSLLAQRTALNPAVMATGLAGGDQAIAAALSQAGGTISDKQRELLMGKALSAQASNFGAGGTGLSPEALLKLILEELKAQRARDGGRGLDDTPPRRRG
ncbi:MAG TPA: phage tail tape measure protein [Beijerinckiaceae bacterium]|nr:phage tail tape measure protein [Beijerinckiaceae bacterium]